MIYLCMNFSYLCLTRLLCFIIKFFLIYFDCTIIGCGERRGGFMKSRGLVGWWGGLGIGIGLLVLDGMGLDNFYCNDLYISML
ncbi:hypothetical protein HOY82DRAFT_419879 [Tuber indicum]|nr:hypothetical protein HOY82DRAFT_419879 [Tuber indicum]